MSDRSIAFIYINLARKMISGLITSTQKAGDKNEYQAMRQKL
jgi:hypothetical protein